jgi:hypothetical protein
MRTSAFDNTWLKCTFHDINPIRKLLLSKESRILIESLLNNNQIINYFGQAWSKIEFPHLITVHTINLKVFQAFSTAVFGKLCYSSPPC